MNSVYASRTGTSETIIPRQDPVIHEGYVPNEFGLTAEQMAQYRHQGFLVLEDDFSDWVVPMLDALPELRERLAGQPSLILEPESQSLRTVFAPHHLSEVFRAFVQDERVLNPVRQLLGGEVYIHQGRVNIKPPLSGKSFPWHSDFETWHVEDGMPRPRALSAWIMLTENLHENGPLLVIPGSHHRYVSCAGTTPDSNYQESLQKQTYGSPSAAALKVLAEKGGIVSITGQPGTVVLHESNLMHGSADNMTVWPRSNAFFVFNSVENTVHEPQGGLEPRPWFLAERESFAPLVPAEERSVAR